MRLRKKRQKSHPAQFLPQLIHNFYAKKIIQNISATSRIKKCPELIIAK
jgi:hypothetical protein